MKKIKAVRYGRYSSNNQREESIEAQFYAIDKYCDANNIEIIKSYYDKEVSGTTDDREYFQIMIEESKHLDYDFVIVHKFDRFARNRFDNAIYKKNLEENGKRVISVLEKIDNSPEGVILESLLEGMAEYYSKNLSREVKKGLQVNARKGQLTGGRPIYGYDTIDGNYVINENEASVVRYIFEQCAKGVGLRTIADNLNEKGYTNKFNRPFKHSSLHYTLRNKKYIGTYEYQPNPSGKRKGKYYRDENCIIIENNHDPIIEFPLWNEVQNIMGEVKPRLKNKSKTYHLTGKIICGQCGGNYFGGGWDGKRFVYECCNRRTSCSNKKINAEKLEEYILNKIHEEYLTIERINKVANDALEIINEFLINSSKEEKRIKSEISNIQDKINRLFDTYLEIGMDKDLFETQTNRLNQQQNKLRNTLNKIGANKEIVNTDMIFTKLMDMRKININSADEDIRMLVNGFVEKIVVDRDGVSLYLYNINEVVGGSVEPPSLAPTITPTYTITLRDLRYYKG